MTTPNSFPTESMPERLSERERIENIHTMAKAILIARGTDQDDRILGPVSYAPWVARGLGYYCELVTPNGEPHRVYQLRFTPIRRPSQQNMYSFRPNDDVISTSIRSVNDDVNRPHIDRLEELMTSGAFAGAYDPTEFEDTEEFSEIEVENPWVNTEDY